MLNWKVQISERPKYNDEITLKTWSCAIDKIHAYRDFEIRNANKEVIAIASSKWVLIDINTGKIEKMTDDLIEKYTIEDVKVFENTNFEKIKSPDEFELEKEYIIQKNMIDVNNHVHNIYYMDIANEILPEEVLENKELNYFEIMYKNGIKYGEKVKTFYAFNNGEHIVTIKNQDETVIHAIIKLKEECNS